MPQTFFVFWYSERHRFVVLKLIPWM